MPTDSRWGRAAPWALFAAALALRLWRLDLEPLWFDEAYTALESSRSVGALLLSLRGEAGAPLYYLALGLWASIFGDGEWALRLPSALAGAAACPWLLRLGTDFCSRRAGWIAGGLAVVSPLHLHYSQEARMYALVALLGLAFLATLRRLALSPSSRSAVGMAAALVAGLYLHYYFLFLVPVALLALRVRERRALRWPLAALALVALGFAPWATSLVHQTGNRSTQWIAEYWNGHSLAFALPWSLECLGPGASYPGWQALKLASSPAVGIASLALAALVVGGLAWVASRSARGSVAESFDSRLVLATLLAPLVLACAVSLVRDPVHVVARYDLISWGPYLLGAGIVLARLGRAGLVVSALWLSLSLWSLVPHFTTLRPVRNYSDMGPTYARQLAELARPGEVVVFTAGTRTTTQYYLRDRRPDLQLASFPPANDEHLGWVVSRVYTDPQFADEAAARLVGDHLSSGADRPVLWITAPGSRGTEFLLRRLSAEGYVPNRKRSVRSLLCLEPPGSDLPRRARTTERVPVTSGAQDARGRRRS